MSEVLARWNLLPIDAAANEILPCCASQAWARGMAERRPLHHESDLLAASDDVCRGLAERDWREAFDSHPRIGESKAPQSAQSRSAAWSAEEQANAAADDNSAKAALAEANQEYERRFGRIFIVCASGKSTAQILEIVRRRLENDQQTELLEAAEQQRQITQIRLRKWLQT